mmetsp:Transcript_27953/g.65738  ORF Transcript_27953/g.65738 Transcript_27953/m.65738 type:complete len:730 (+) Transcript_27953:259-2448(+)|eukprot:CAMPEP_0197194136 /NCGR_PEP_ID=MMETSP1423-20130617/28695_1 /TAXON_ID=476441 /ORGANISM="Pseudo-nitzschia heimii, Strain UNC1101" /LENGTH=729 /DNA_ID=CAMNT_0042647507 /DNA_START=209 /DNA_END=2398 /DNA_ORIENTATION=+
MASGKSEENATVAHSREPSKLKSDSSEGDDNSTKATEENDSDATMESKSPESKKDDNSDAETDVDDSGSSNESNMTQEEKDKEAKEKEEAEKKKIEELKKKYKNWPLKDIKEPHDNDVMYGRGGGTNHHPGNKQYRKMVEDRKVKYVNSKRLDKPLVALEIIREWRGQLPPGRFLKHNDKTGLWDDVGDKKAREKTSQALREKAPQIRKQQEEEKDGEDTGDKTTRFAKGTKDNKKGKLKKAILARDHSLGREYLASGEDVDIGDFTWQDPFKKDRGKDSSVGSKGSEPITLPGRDASIGSIGSFPPPFARNNVPDFWGKVSFGETRRELSNGSFGSLGSWGPPYPPPPQGPMAHQRSGSWTYGPHPPLQASHDRHHQRSGSWNTGREHSFSLNPLQHTNINRPAPTGAFDQRTGSGEWNAPNNYPPGPPQRSPPQHPPPPSPYGGFAYQSGSSIGTIGSMEPPPPGSYAPRAANATSPPYDVTGAAAKAWSGQGGAAAPPPPPGTFWRPQYDGHPQPAHGADRSLPREMGRKHPYETVPRPGTVKRDTSNQNETYETKPSMVKKAALNRDQSATSNRLKKQYIPEALSPDVQEPLHERTERQLRLHSPVPNGANAPPRPLSNDSGAPEGSSEDAAPSSIPQPAALNQSDRKNTMDALGYGDLIDNSGFERVKSDDASYSELPPLPALGKPPKLTESDRLSTSEFLDICDATLPISDDKEANDDAPLPL